MTKHCVGLLYVHGNNTNLNNKNASIMMRYCNKIDIPLLFDAFLGKVHFYFSFNKDK